MLKALKRTGGDRGITERRESQKTGGLDFRQTLLGSTFEHSAELTLNLTSKGTVYRTSDTFSAGSEGIDAGQQPTLRNGGRKAA
jgi:hypothetical protein